MNSSVNWYFQAVDEQLGTSDVYSYVQEIGYGNENMSGDFSSYWMESSWKSLHRTGRTFNQAAE